MPRVNHSRLSRSRTNAAGRSDLVCHHFQHLLALGGGRERLAAPGQWGRTASCPHEAGEDRAGGRALSPGRSPDPPGALSLSGPSGLFPPSSAGRAGGHRASEWPSWVETRSLTAVQGLPWFEHPRPPSQCPAVCVCPHVKFFFSPGERETARIRKFKVTSALLNRLYLAAFLYSPRSETHFHSKLLSLQTSLTSYS